MTVYLSEPIAASAYQRLAAECEIVNNFDHPEQLDGILIRRVKVTRDIISRAENLKIISMHGVGLDTIDLAAAREYGVRVTNVPGQNAESVAELAVSFMLALARKEKAINDGLCVGKYQRIGVDGLIGTEMYGKKVGFVGGGHVASRTAEILNAAFRTRNYCYDPGKTEQELAAVGCKKVETVAELFEQMDFVSIHVPLLPSTRDMINADIFRRANPNLILVNTSRGGVVNEDDLYTALTTGQIQAAASDVFTQEPPAEDSPLLRLDNFIATMHVGGSTKEALERVSNAAVDNLLNALHCMMQRQAAQ